tara:strand:- start:6219 stop:10703 length:4485 start_codon:yes stop_codon:yes gene_type:complete
MQRSIRHKILNKIDLPKGVITGGFLFWIALFPLGVFGQAYVSDCEILGEQLEKELAQSSSEHAKWVKKSLKPKLCDLELRSTQLDSIALFCNALDEKRITTSKGFLDYLLSIEQLILRKDPELWKSWHHVVNAMLENKKWKRDLAPFLKLSPALIREQALSLSAGATWTLEDVPFELSVDSVPLLTFQNARLIGKNKNDRIEVERTSGVWDLTTNRIQLSGGKLPWTGTQFDSLGYYAELGPFELKLNSNGFSCGEATWHADLIANPLQGRVTTKLQNISKQDSKTYPRFNSDFDIIRLEGLYEGVIYEGGMSVKGARISGIGSPDELAKVDVFRNDTVFMTFQSTEFLFSPRGFSSSHSRMILSFRNDTIGHPDVSVRLDDESGFFRVMRQTEGLGQQSFTDSYHDISWDVDGFTWNRKESKVSIGSVFGGSSKAGVFASDAFFKRESFLMMKGIGDIHPLSRVKDFVEDSGQREFSSEDYARFIHMSELQARVELLNLANAGFVYFDPETSWCVVLPKVFSNIRNFSGREDYDVLQWQSSPKSGANAEWSLLNGFMSIYGVDYVFLSDSQDVKIVPRNREVVLSDNRDFTFNGRLIAGNLDMNGEGFSFDYDSFSIELNQISSVNLSVNEDSNLDARGNPFKQRVRTVLSEVSGTLAIDHPNNRSGVWSRLHAEYPIFTSIDPSFVYFDQPELYQGAYKRDAFYYAVDPFVLKRLDDLTSETLKFNGTLVSAGILADLQEPLRVMDDMHLGFQSETPQVGQVVYGTSARFTNGVILNGSGLQGAGRIDFLTAEIRSNQLVFLPDSTIGYAEWMVNDRSASSDVPSLKNKDGYVVFRPLVEELEMRSGEEPLALFDEDVFLEGHSTLSNSGLTASGLIVFSDASLTSCDFNLKERQILSDSAAFQVSGRTSGIAAFQTNDVRCQVDFDERIGDFMPNSGETKIELPIQQYICYMDRFRWFMDQDAVDLISDRQTENLPFDFSEDRKISNFVSVHPEQDSLHFLSIRATYRIEDDFLRCQDVKELAIADARIFPDSGIVIVRKGAQIDQLTNAGLVANDVTRQHYIDGANLTVRGRLSFEGQGDYRYRSILGDTTYIFMDEIYVDESYQTRANGQVVARDGFALGPAFGFAGLVNMASSEPNLWFEGGVKLLKPCDEFLSTWIHFESFLDPLDLAIPLDTNVRDVDGDLLAYGLMASSQAPFSIQSGFLDPLGDDTDIKLMPVEGALRFADDHYVISSLEKFENASAAGNRINLNVNQCDLSGSGDMSLPFNFNLVSHDFAGEFFQDAQNRHHVKGTFRLDFHFEDDLFERMTEQIPSWVSSEPVDVGQTNYEQALVSWLGKEKSEKLLNDLAMTGQIKNVPKKLQNSLVFTGVDFIWDDNEEMFVSEGNIGLVTLGKHLVFQEIPGKIELIRSRSGDAFRLYLHGDEGNWYYFEYKLGKLNVSSPDLILLTMIADIKKDKKEVKGENGSRFLYQYLRNTIRRDDLVDKYRDFD